MLATAAGDDGVSGADRPYLEQVALAQARSGLLVLVQDLSLKSGVSLGAWAAQDIAFDRALRLWVRTQPQHGYARVYSDNACDVDVRLSPEALRTRLRLLTRRHAEQLELPLSTAELESAARSWPMLWSTGTAWPAAREPKAPRGWEDTTAEGRQLAQRAATAEALQALLSAAGQLRATPARHLGDFLDAAPAFRDAALTGLAHTATVDVVYDLDQVATASARVALSDLIHVIVDAQQTHAADDLFRHVDFREMVLLAGPNGLTATGSAVVPGLGRIGLAHAPLEPGAPAWVDQSLSVVGRYVPFDAGYFDEAIELAVARQDGSAQLRQKIVALPLEDGSTVAQLLVLHPRLADDLTLFLSAARETAPPEAYADGSLGLKLELPLRRLWTLIRHHRQPREATAPAGKD